VNLVFGLDIDNTGTHSMTVTSYWLSTASFACDPYEYAGAGQGTAGTGGAFFSGDPSTGYQIFPTVNTPSGGESIQLICWNVPTGAGIATINWSP
jgi:hypothetical protein